MKPKYVKIKEKKYKINTDFRNALECQKIAMNNNIGDYERALAIIYKLFGNKGLENKEDWEELLEKGTKFLSLGKEYQKNNNDDPNFDFEQDLDYIEASFISDYGIDLEKENMHWWKFYNLLNGLTENCVLNRVRYVRDFDISDIKDYKERKKWIEQKKAVSLKNEKHILTKKEKESVKKFYELVGIKKEGDDL